MPHLGRRRQRPQRIETFGEQVFNIPSRAAMPPNEAP